MRKRSHQINFSLYHVNPRTTSLLTAWKYMYFLSIACCCGLIMPLDTYFDFSLKTFMYVPCFKTIACCSFTRSGRPPPMRSGSSNDTLGASAPHTGTLTSHRRSTPPPAVSSFPSSPSKRLPPVIPACKVSNIQHTFIISAVLYSVESRKFNILVCVTCTR